MATILHPYMHFNSLTNLNENTPVPSPPALLDDVLKQSLLSPNRLPPTPTGLLSLPPELILSILELMNPPSLLATSHTCHSLHHMAYSIYLVRIGLGPQCGHLMLFNDESPKALEALNGALFKPALGTATCVLQSSCDTVIRARREVDDLKKLLGKLSSLNEFHLDFIDFKDHVTSTVEEEKEMKVNKKVNVDVVKEVAWILDAVVGLGCTKITVCLLGVLRAAVSFTPENGRLHMNITKENLGLRSRILELLPVGLRNVIPKLQQEKPNQLEVFNLHSPILLEHRFFNWTVDILNHSRITTLSLNQMVRIPTSLWADFLSMLYLPRLTTLLVDVLALSPQDALDFLERHPGLERLYVGNNVLCPFHCHPGHELEVQHKLLPNLRYLSASASFLSQLLFSPDSLPKLCEVSVLETIKPESEFVPDTLRATLAPIATRLLQVPQVQLTLSFRSQFSPPPVSSPSASSPLPNIISRFSSLELQIHVYRLSEEARCGLPAFLGIFSGLKSLEFTTVAKAGPVEADEWPQLVKDIWVRCPALQMVGVNGDVRTVTKWL
ncbi:hypothetical protein BDQ17DRAFT_1068044 [Cyathus striatus]|nr:hypothetical protein BDQ17DRAFT_1068044 [Cyathus striatus]